MKNLLFTITLLLPLFSYAQKDTTGLSLTVSDGKLLYQGVVESKMHQKELYKNAKQWLVDYFREYKAVIQTEDSDQDHLSAKGMFYIKTHLIGIARNFNDNFTIQIDFKDGKYRYKVYDFYIRSTDSSLATTYSLNDLYNKLLGNKSVGFTKGQCRDLLSDNDNRVKKMITSLTSAMQSTSDF